METIDDIRREGHQRTGPVGGPPRSIFSFFRMTAGRMVSLILLVLGIVVLLLGSVFFQAPLMLAGLVVALIAGVGWMWSKPKKAETA